MRNNSALSAFFDNKTVVITGAGSGIGEGLAKVFADLGCKLAICDIDAQALNNVVTHIKQAHPKLEIYFDVLDVANKHQWASFLANAVSSCNHIDIVINNAGIEGSCRPVWATDDATLERVMDVNFYGMVYGSKAALPYLAQRQWAALVNVSSIFGMIAPPNTADYCASKFAIRGYTESLRAELALLHPQIQVHLVHPGGINTNITRVPESQKFKHRYLTTAPADIALHIAKCLMNNKARIVFGNQANLAHFASRILSLKWLNKLSGRGVKQLEVEADYAVNHQGFERNDSLGANKERLIDKS